MGQRAGHPFLEIRAPREPFETASGALLFLGGLSAVPGLTGKLPGQSVGHGTDGRRFGYEQRLRSIRTSFLSQIRLPQQVLLLRWVG
jgi:hypothetical protein